VGLNLDGVKGLRKQPPNASMAMLSLSLGEDRTVPTEFRIFAAGANPSDKGTFIFDDLAAKAVMTSYAAKSVPLTMDYEHMALSDPPVPAPAAASEWTPEVRGGELWATNVKWTDKARAMLAAGEYRLFSPAFYHDPKTMRVLRIINVALTNTPALNGIAPLVAASTDHHQEIDMKPTSCSKCKTSLKAPTDDNDGDEAYCKGCFGSKASMLTLVGLKATANEGEIATELSAIASFGSEIMTLTGQTARAAAIGVIAGWKQNAAEVVALRAATADVEAKALKAEFDGVLATASTEGKMTPAERETFAAMTLRLTGGKVTRDAVDAVKAHVTTLSSKVSTTPTPGKDPGTSLLTPEDYAIAKAMGNKIEDVQAFKVEQLKAQQQGAH
jgi:phage I-like protein